MAIKSAYSASLSCSSFIPFENSKMGLMNSNCRPATNRREQGEATTIVSSLSRSLSHNKLPGTHRSTLGSGEDRQARKTPYIMFQVWLKPPFTSHHYWWPLTVADELGSNCKMTLFLSFLRALNAPQLITRQQLKEHNINYQISPSKSQKPTSTTSTLSTLALLPSHSSSNPEALLLSKKALIPCSRLIWSPSELKIYSSKKSELCHFLQLKKLGELRQSLT